MDLKPKNIMLNFPNVASPLDEPEKNIYQHDISDDNYQVKFIDMGYIVQLDPPNNGVNQQKATLTNMKGTRFYDAPEILVQLNEGEIGDPFFYT